MKSFSTASQAAAEPPRPRFFLASVIAPLAGLLPLAAVANSLHPKDQMLHLIRLAMPVLYLIGCVGGYVATRVLYAFGRLSLRRLLVWPVIASSIGVSCLFFPFALDLVLHPMGFLKRENLRLVSGIFGFPAVSLLLVSLTWWFFAFPRKFPLVMYCPGWTSISWLLLVVYLLFFPPLTAWSNDQLEQAAQRATQEEREKADKRQRATNLWEWTRNGDKRAIPLLEKDFQQATEHQKLFIAASLVRLGVEDRFYWDFLTERVKVAIESEIPTPLGS